MRALGHVFGSLAEKISCGGYLDLLPKICLKFKQKKIACQRGEWCLRNLGMTPSLRAQPSPFFPLHLPLLQHRNHDGLLASTSRVPSLRCTIGVCVAAASFSNPANYYCYTPVFSNVHDNSKSWSTESITRVLPDERQKRHIQFSRRLRSRSSR